MVTGSIHTLTGPVSLAGAAGRANRSREGDGCASSFVSGDNSDEVSICNLFRKGVQGVSIEYVKLLVSVESHGFSCQTPAQQHVCVVRLNVYYTQKWPLGL